MSDYDYRGEGAYFITICTRGRTPIFGNVQNDLMQLSQRGLIANRCWLDIPIHRKNVELDEFVIMPNHMHGIFWTTSAIEPEPTSGLEGSRKRPRLLPLSVGAIVGAYKAAVSREINCARPGMGTNMWQANYFEHIVRTQRSLDAIREYIINNPQRWEEDAENPDGDGSDQVMSWVQTLRESSKSSKKRVPTEFVGARLVSPNSGETSLAPTKDQRGSR